VLWGDGSSTTYNGIGTGHIASHMYGSAGMYTATVTVSDEDGGTSVPVTAAMTLNFIVVDDGFKKPLDEEGKKEFKSKGTSPLKLKVLDCDGTGAEDLTVTLQVMQLTGAGAGTLITPDTKKGSDTPGVMEQQGKNEYHFKLWAKLLPDPDARYRVTATILQTGQTVEATFGLK
jgi:PKD repeat protein